MCNFFSFITEPENHGGKRYYFDWKYRKAHLSDDGSDSHSTIAKHYRLDEDKCNKYEYNPLTKEFVVDQTNSQIDDQIQAFAWASNLDFKRIVEPMIIKPIINPFDLPKAKITDEHKAFLKQWSSVGASVRSSVRASVWASVGASVRAPVGASAWDSVRSSVRAPVGASAWASAWASVRDAVWASVRSSVGASVRDAVGDSVGASVRASVRAYILSFFDIEYKYDFTPAVKLWEAGIVPSFDGTNWRLHSGKDAEVIYFITNAELAKGE